MSSPTRHFSDEPMSVDASSSSSSSQHAGPSRPSSRSRSSHDGIAGSTSPPSPRDTEGYAEGASEMEDAPLSPLQTDFGRKERQGSIIPDFIASPAADNHEVDVHLSHHRRRSTILHRHRRNKSERRGSAQVGDFEEPHTALDLGEETAEERAERELMDNQVDEEERANAGVERQAIEIKAYGMDWNEWGEDDEDGVKMKDLPSGFAWDVIFENQRGIHVFGKAYFSSNSLLPADPSAYTVPSHALPTATSLTISSPSGQLQHRKKLHMPPISFSRAVASTSHTAVHANPSIPAEYKSYPGNTMINLGINRDTRTAYTPETAQCPDPTWEWLTPWMINMKTGTDEGGWRYNAWFKKKGWKPHAGTAGWAGWVRRREWVRLRSIKQEREIRKRDEDEELEHISDKPPDTKDRPIEAIMTAMGKMAVDRERLAAWHKWLEDKAFRDTVASLLEEHDSRDRMRDGFTYSSNFEQLLHQLRPHDQSSDHDS